jgi:hypothetical protein
MGTLMDLVPGALVLAVIVIAGLMLYAQGAEDGRRLGECDARCLTIGEARLRDGACECVVGVTPAGEGR